MDRALRELVFCPTPRKGIVGKKNHIPFSVPNDLYSLRILRLLAGLLTAEDLLAPPCNKSNQDHDHKSDYAQPLSIGGRSRLLFFYRLLAFILLCSLRQ